MVALREDPAVTPTLHVQAPGDPDGQPSQPGDEHLLGQGEGDEVQVVRLDAEVKDAEARSPVPVGLRDRAEGPTHDAGEAPCP